MRYDYLIEQEGGPKRGHHELYTSTEEGKVHPAKRGMYVTRRMTALWVNQSEASENNHAEVSGSFCLAILLR